MEFTENESFIPNKAVEPKKELEEIVVCDCGSYEHQIIIKATDWGDGDEDNGFVYLEVHLTPMRWWKRLWYGIKYIFGYRCCYGAFEEVILKPSDVTKFEKVVKWLKEHNK